AWQLARLLRLTRLGCEIAPKPAGLCRLDRAHVGASSARPCQGARALLPAAQIDQNASMLLAQSDSDAYERHGAICLRRVFEPRWLRLIAGGIEKEIASASNGLVEQQDRGLPGRFMTDYCPAQRIREFQDFIIESSAAEIAGSVMRSSTAPFLID